MDEYVWLHEVLVASAGEENIGLIDRAQALLFRDIYGNMVRLGDVYLSPADNPAVYEYEAFMRDSYDKWPTIYGGIYETEADAVEAAMGAGGSVLAVLHFNEMDPELGIFNISMRFNHTVVPSTHPDDIFKYLPNGIWTKYQRYVWSGFLTLQHTLSLFAKKSSPLYEVPSADEVARGIVIGQYPPRPSLPPSPCQK